MRVTSLEPEGIEPVRKHHKTRPIVAKSTDRSSREARGNATTTENTGSITTIAIGEIRIGCKVRITAGQAKDIEGVVIAEYMPLRPRSWRTWTVKTPDLVGRREIRHEYLEVIP